MIDPNLQALYRAVFKYKFPIQVHALAPGVAIIRTAFVPAGHSTEKFFSLFQDFDDMDNAHEYWLKEVEMLSAVGDTKERLRWVTATTKDII